MSNCELNKEWAITHLGKPLGESGNEWKYRCPLHEDENPSFSLNVEEGVYNCFSACGGGNLHELAMKMEVDKPKYNLVHNSNSNDTVYSYEDIDGKVIFQSVRFRNPKSFRQRQPDGKGGWKWNLDGVKPVLYKLPEINKAIQEKRRIFVVEGEKDVETLRKDGLTATCNPMGAGKWKKEYTETLKSATEVIVLPDHDEPGMAHAIKVTADLGKAGVPVWLVRLYDDDPTKDHGNDITDWLSIHPIRDLEDRIDSARITPYSNCNKSKTSIVFTQIINQIKFPFMANNNYYGVIAGEIYDLKSSEFKEYIRRQTLKLTGAVEPNGTIESIADQINAQFPVDMKPKPFVVGKRSLQSPDAIFWRLDKKSVVKITDRLIAIEPTTATLEQGMAFLPSYPAADIPYLGPKDSSYFINWFEGIINHKIQSPDDRKLLTLIVLSGFVPTGERPAPFFHGAQGAGKSTLTLTIKNLVDPMQVGIIGSQPKEKDDVFVCASKMFVVGIDNIGTLKIDIQDALSTIITGGGYQARQLFSNSNLSTIICGETFFLFNGISMPALQNDLLDRIIPFEVSVGNDKDKMRLMKECEDLRPDLLGSIMKAVSQAMKSIGMFQNDTTVTRFGTWEKWLYAFSGCVGWSPDKVREVLKKLTKERAYEAAGTDDVCIVLKKIAEKGRKVLATAELLKEFKHECEDVATEIDPKAKHLPQTPAAFGKKLVSLTGDLARTGIRLEKQGKQDGNSTWLLEVMK